MGNGISFNGVYPNIGQYSQDFENIAKYTLGTTIVNGEDSPFQGMGLMVGIAGGMEAFKAMGKAYKYEMPEGYLKGLTAEEAILAKKMANPFALGGWKKAASYKNAINNIKNYLNKGVGKFKTDLEFQKNLFSNGGLTKASSYKTLWNNYSADVVKEAIPTNLTNLGEEAQGFYTKAKRAAELVKENPLRARKLINIADKNLALAEKAASAEKLLKPATGFFGKIGRWLGLSKLNCGLKGLAAESPTLSKVLKFGKGNGWFAAITGAIELFTQVIPSFTQLGAGSGMKQLGKSTAKVGASVGGWAAGMAIGGGIGTMICPGPGTLIGGAIGTICGIIGGCLGSWGATKLTEEIVGKDELTLAKEKEAKELAQQATQSPETAQKLLAAAGEKLQAEGNESEDAKVAFGSLTRLSQGLSTNNQTQYAQNNPNFTGTDNKQTTNTNPFKFNPNAYSQPDFMDKDFMAMNAGIV